MPHAKGFKSEKKGIYDSFILLVLLKDYKTWTILCNNRDLDKLMEIQIKCKSLWQKIKEFKIIKIDGLKGGFEILRHHKF